ncbi:hypothetical protein [Pseudaestuariivita atlantica]|uniref:Uncharacterized protein n=1 Tax=Pseudaestuariivita atlantica TaxID=1317121 RepID=A0A0L1JUK6_9RHOB|nr:hypothetical protein [Pseudaestuariivita atlantica]KNG95098.1 hypothetical protein ATO11_00105 [Pseudaestuariivita atlantica]
MLHLILVLLSFSGVGAEPADTAVVEAAVQAPEGGVTLEAEDQTPTGRFLTATEVRPILNATRANWIAVRDFNGQDLVYVTHLWSWRCGLLRIEVAINGGAFEDWPMPACHDDTSAPNAILPEDGLPYIAHAGGSVKEVAVRITYDDLGTDEARFDGKGMLQP